ncbi:baseplate J/gp47 family protein [Mucilaginibacter lappiensis]|uniref:Baseplate J-like protein n=1 Tax=Mucilaginibacter lappiensis TaxID=354630 RepID=A0A841JK07_9SPHI|nr:baseplate J/gp47 family protein [Mucilaginibacter lappiensis]MBB6131320.1 hypothetical protein [Mucilaginibacter lappiensis]
MARTIQEIEDEINAAKVASTALDGLTSVSNTAVWRLWIFITAGLFSNLERLWDLFQAVIQAIIDNNQYGNDPWWQKKVLAFQYGDLLAFINNIYQYPVIDTTKQIVQFCSITSNGGKVQIKAAGSVAGQPAVLTADQVAGLLSYCQTIRPSGVKFTVQSLVADTLKMYLNIYYDASGDINVIKAAVKTAIQNYLSNLNTVTFDGTLYVNKLIDAIQVVPGVIGNQVDVLSIAAKNGPDAYTTFTSSYQPKAGYFMIDPDFNLDTTITYLAV